MQQPQIPGQLLNDPDLTATFSIHTTPRTESRGDGKQCASSPTRSNRTTPRSGSNGSGRIAESSGIFNLVGLPGFGQLDPENRERDVPTPDAKDALQEASRAMGDLFITPPTSIRPGSNPQMIGSAAGRSLEEANAPGDASSRSVRAMSKAERMFNKLGDGAPVSKLAFLGAVSTNMEVAKFLFPSLPTFSGRDASRLNYTGCLFENIANGRTSLSVNDLVRYCQAEKFLYRLFNRFGGLSDVVSQDVFIAALERDALLCELLMPGMQKNSYLTDQGKRREMMDRFAGLADSQNGMSQQSFMENVRGGLALQDVLSLAGLKASQQISKLELIGAVASTKEVASLFLLEYGIANASMENTENIPKMASAFDGVYKKGNYLTLDEFNRLRGTLPKDDNANPVHTTTLPTSVPEDLALLTRTTSSGHDSSGNLPIVGWIAGVQDRLRGPPHPLEARELKFADMEARVAIWGKEKPGPKDINYEDEYDHTPFFCLFTSLVQLLCYIGGAGVANMEWDGPISKPEWFWLRTYNENCGDTRFEVWRMWFYQFSHACFLHVLGNVFGNVYLGGLLEAVHGWKRIAPLYTFGVITGALTCGAWQPHMVAVGANGGVYTMIGAHIANLIINKENMPNTFWIKVLAIVAFLIYDTVDFVVNYSNGIPYAAHIGGWLCGLLYGGHWLVNLEEKPFELSLIKWLKRFYMLYIVFCVLWISTQESGNPQGVFESVGSCRFRN